MTAGLPEQLWPAALEHANTVINLTSVQQTDDGREICPEQLYEEGYRKLNAAAASEAVARKKKMVKVFGAPAVGYNELESVPK